MALGLLARSVRVQCMYCHITGIHTGKDQAESNGLVFCTSSESLIFVCFYTCSCYSVDGNACVMVHSVVGSMHFYS